MATLEAVLNDWAVSGALSQPLAHRLKQWLPTEGYPLDVEPAAHFYALTDVDLEKAGFNRIAERRAILTVLRQQTGYTSMAAGAVEAYARLEAKFDAKFDALAGETSKTTGAVEAVAAKVDALAVPKVSITNRYKVGEALLARTSQQPDLFEEELAGLDEPLLLQIVAATADAFREAHAVPAMLLSEKDVQKLYVSLLMALQAAHPMGSLQVHDTHATGLSAMSECKPDIVVADCDEARAAYVVDYFELKARLSKASSQNDAAYQVDQRRQQLAPEQPSRGVFWACIGDLQNVELWQLDRKGVALRRLPHLRLFCHRDSAGLQALVRLWCTPPKSKGYHAPELPRPIKLQQDERRLERLRQLKRNSSAADDTASADVTMVVEGVLEPGNTPAVAKTTSNLQRLSREEIALRDLQHVDGVVKLVDAVTSDDGRSWLVMQPVGDLINLDAPAAVKVAALKQLAKVIGSLGSNGYIHGDISHYNVLCKRHPPSGGASPVDVFLIDFGTARKQDIGPDPCYTPNHTGTPMFMAISTLMGQRQEVSSDLESAYYVFLYWATRDQLHWRRADFDPITWSGHAIDLKISAMTILFEEKVLKRIHEAELYNIAERLHALFFAGGKYNKSVSSEDFVQAMS